MWQHCAHILPWKKRMMPMGKRWKEFNHFFPHFFIPSSSVSAHLHTLYWKKEATTKKLNNRAVHFRELRNWGKQQKRRAHTRQKEQTHKKNLNWNFTINGKRRKLEGWDLKERTHKKKSSSIVLHDETCSFMKNFVPFSNCLFFLFILVGLTNKLSHTFLASRILVASAPNFDSYCAFHGKIATAANRRVTRKVTQVLNFSICPRKGVAVVKNARRCIV